MKIVGLGTLLVLTATAAHAGGEASEVLRRDANREGHCVAARVNGQSTVVTQADVVQGNRLPPGKYVVTSRVSGSIRNWDCHSFFVQVAE